MLVILSMANLKPKIVVVDDEPVIDEHLVKFLSQEGYEVTSFTRGEKALEYLSDHPVNLMLVDMHMPEMDGVEVIKTAKQIKPDLPIIVMTGSPDSEIVEIAIELSKLGVSNYLKEPFPLSYLERVIAQAIKGGEKLWSDRNET